MQRNGTKTMGVVRLATIAGVMLLHGCALFEPQPEVVEPPPEVVDVPEPVAPPEPAVVSDAP